MPLKDVPILQSCSAPSPAFPHRNLSHHDLIPRNTHPQIPSFGTAGEGQLYVIAANTHHRRRADDLQSASSPLAPMAPLHRTPITRSAQLSCRYFSPARRKQARPSSSGPETGHFLAPPPSNSHHDFYEKKPCQEKGVLTPSQQVPGWQNAHGRVVQRDDPRDSLRMYGIQRDTWRAGWRDPDGRRISKSPRPPDSYVSRGRGRRSTQHVTMMEWAGTVHAHQQSSQRRNGPNPGSTPSDVHHIA